MPQSDFAPGNASDYKKQPAPQIATTTLAVALLSAIASLLQPPLISLTSLPSTSDELALNDENSILERCENFIPATSAYR
jgi:hypothetical protein